MTIDEKRLFLDVIHLLEILKEDAEMALDGRWDCTIREGIDNGFLAQVELIDIVLIKLKKVI